FFIDSAMAVPQLLAEGVDAIILDYLAEGAMGLLGRMRLADPASGFPSDFMDVHIGPFLKEIAAKGTRIVANAGGVNPAALCDKLRARIADLGLDIKVACIAGDDLMGRLDQFSETRDMFTGAPFPQSGVTSANAYLGAFPIAAALAQGAQIVVTGRVVDSALTLGLLIDRFGWSAHDFAELAGGTLAGHLIECGAQVTGGTFTDWREVEGWATIGAPIAECHADGTCVITKPKGSGGLVSVGTVSEQMLYEVGDPQAYFVPDVTCDFSTVRIAQDGPDRVRVSGATGHPPTATLKACATWDDGWRAVAYQPVIGKDAAAKAAKQAEALFERGRLMLRGRNLANWRRAEMVPIGSGEEVIAKLVVEHDEAFACQMFAREQFAAISAMAPGTSVAFGVSVQPCMSLISFLVDKATITATLDGEPCPLPAVSGFDPAMIQRPDTPTASPGTQTRTLEDLAFARSGEKGETINVGVIARRPEWRSALRAALTGEALRDWLPDLGAFTCQIYDVPGCHALNLVLECRAQHSFHCTLGLSTHSIRTGNRISRCAMLLAAGSSR
ncbi:MAG: DUF1446 domain-containing protein, partial [Novosphingobium sp.]|nr:DUF1446 domain-containing protein [Novosphingobium sp.]